MSGSVDLGDSPALSRYAKLRSMGSSGTGVHLESDSTGTASSKVSQNPRLFDDQSILKYESSSLAQRQRQPLNGNGSAEDRDKTPTARLASPPPAAESNTTQSTISRLENKYADILNKIARRKRQENESDDDGVVGDVSKITTRPARSRIERDDREKTLEADNSTLSKNSVESRKDDIGGFAGLSKSSTVIHVPQAKKKEVIAAKVESKYADKEDKAISRNGSRADITNENGHKSTTAFRRGDHQHNGDGEDLPSYLSRYKTRNERDTSNRYKDTSQLMDSLKATPAKPTSYSHYAHYDNPALDSVSSYYKSRYEPEAYGADAGYSTKAAEKPSGLSAATRRTKSYRTRKEGSRDRKHLTMKLSAVNMDIDSPPPPPQSATTKASGSSATGSGRSYKQYGAARKSLGTGLTSGSGYQRSQTQKLLYDFDDNDIYHPPTPRDNKRKEIQNVIRKYAQYDDEDLRRNTKNPYSTNSMKSATSANLAYLSQGGGGGSGGSGGGSNGSHLCSDRRDPIADHYGLGTSGSSYYPRTHYGYDYPSYGSSALSKATNPYTSAASAAALNPYNPLSKTISSAACYNSSYLGGGGGGGAGSGSAAAQRSRRNLMSFVRELFVGVVDFE